MICSCIEKLFHRFTSMKAVKRICVICIVAFFYLLLGMDRNVGIYDEGLILAGADRVAAGDIPHRDFYCNYGPAQFYILASLFKVFSASVLVERLWDTFIRMAIVLMVFLIIEKLGSLKSALIASVISLIWLCAFEYHGYPVFPALLFALISVYCLIPAFMGEQVTPRLLFSGICVGIITLFRYDVGFIVCVIGTTVLSAYMLSTSRTKKLTNHIKAIFTYWGGIALVFLPAAVAYLSFATLDGFIYDILYYPSEYYFSMRSLPFPDFFSGYNILIYLPIIIWLISVVTILKLRKTYIHKERFWPIVMLTLMSISFYSKGMVRVSVIHMALSIIPALVLLFVIISIKVDLNIVIELVGVLCITISIFVALSMLVGKLSSIKNTLIWQLSSDVCGFFSSPRKMETAGSCMPPAGLERIACFQIDTKRFDAIKYLQKHTKSEDYIFSGTTRHDKIFINNIALYFIANRRSATKWHHFDPGLQTTEEIQKKMVKEFEIKKPQYIVLESEWDGIAEPNKSAISSGINILDSYITYNYKVVALFGDVKVMLRN